MSRVLHRSGGIPPVVLIPFLMLFLPESPRFLIAHRADAPATQAILRKLNVSAQAAATKLVDVAKGNPVQQLFTGGLAIPTVLLWIAFFANLLNMYLFSYWMPTVLTLSGFKPENAVFYASMFSLGGILSCVVLGPAIDRWVIENALRWLVSEADEREKLMLCSINLSGQSLGDDKFLPFVIDQFHRSGLDASKICFEITETAAIASFSRYSSRCPTSGWLRTALLPSTRRMSHSMPPSRDQRCNCSSVKSASA